MPSIRPIRRRRVVALDTRCRLMGQLMWFGRARLFPQWVLVTGWTVRGRFRHQIALADVAEVQWYQGSEPGQPNLALRLRDGGAVQLRVVGAGLWKLTLDEALNHAGPTADSERITLSLGDGQSAEPTLSTPSTAS